MAIEIEKSVWHKEGSDEMTAMYTSNVVGETERHWKCSWKDHATGERKESLFRESELTEIRPDIAV